VLERKPARLVAVAMSNKTTDRPGLGCREAKSIVRSITFEAIAAHMRPRRTVKLPVEVMMTI
jgi:hypothetical protein